MRYDAFKNIDRSMAEQELMEKLFKEVCSTAYDEPKTCINEMLKPAFAACSANERTLTLSFQTEEWMNNPNGAVHGGIISTMLDMSMGTIARYYRETDKVVTAEINISFMRPIMVGDTVYVTAKAEKSGRRVVFMSAKAYTRDIEKAAACATAVFV